MSVRTLVVVNPRSRNGATGRQFASLETRLHDSLGSLEVEWTRAPRDAERIAREGVRAGIERIVVAGGDGTTSEVVSGLLGAELGDSYRAYRNNVPMLVPGLRPRASGGVKSGCPVHSLHQ